MPKTVVEAIGLDKNNGNTLWKEAIAKEIKNMRAAFKILVEDGNPPPCYKKIRCHMIFDISMEDFRRRTRLVAGGHITKPPDIIMYAIVASRETIRIELIVAALNDLQAMTEKKICLYKSTSS